VSISVQRCATVDTNQHHRDVRASIAILTEALLDNQEVRKSNEFKSAVEMTFSAHDMPSQCATRDGLDANITSGKRIAQSRVVSVHAEQMSP
jgi:hypothetical protein